MSKTLRKIIAFSVSLWIVFAASVPVSAAGTVSATNAAASWLQQTVPRPTIGDETTMLALLRGGFASGIQSNTQSYLNDLVFHINSGGLASQPVADTAKQGMVALAAGIDIGAEAPEIIQALRQTDTVIAQGADAITYTLIFYRSMPDGIVDTATLEALIAGLAALQDETGTLGNAVSTARGLQAFALYPEIAGAEQASLDAQMWLTLNNNDSGGYTIEEGESVTAVAEVIIALSCLGYDPSLLNYDGASLSDALLTMQKEDGSFSAVIGDSSSPDATAISLLALSALQRYITHTPATIYDFSDAITTSIMPLSPSSTPVLSEASSSVTGTPTSFSPFVLVAIICLALLLATSIILLVLRGKKGR